MSSIEVIAKINKYQELLKAFSVRDGCEEQILLVLHKLGKQDINIELLKETGVGKVVNSLRSMGGEIATVANQLVSRWKSLINVAFADKKVDETLPSSSDRSSKQFQKDDRAKSKVDGKAKPNSKSSTPDTVSDVKHDTQNPNNSKKRKNTSSLLDDTIKKQAKKSMNDDATDEQSNVCSKSINSNDNNINNIIPTNVPNNTSSSTSGGSSSMVSKNIGGGKSSSKSQINEDNDNKLKSKDKKDKKRMEKSSPASASTSKVESCKTGEVTKVTPVLPSSSSSFTANNTSLKSSTPIEKGKISEKLASKKESKNAISPPDASQLESNSGKKSKKAEKNKEVKKRKRNSNDDDDDDNLNDDENKSDDDNNGQSFMALCNYDYKATVGNKKKKPRSKTADGININDNAKNNTSSSSSTATTTANKNTNNKTSNPAKSTSTTSTKAMFKSFANNSSSNSSSNHTSDAEMEINQYLKDLSTQSDAILDKIKADDGLHSDSPSSFNDQQCLEPYEPGLRSNNRSAVFCGKRTAPLFTQILTLKQLCQRMIYDYIDNVEHVGITPYFLMEPVLKKCTAQQLENFEFHNPHMILETDELWKSHSQKQFPNKKPKEMETWREVYMDGREEMKAKLEKCVVSIGATSAKIKNEVNKVKFIDACIAPAKRRSGWGGPQISVVEKAPVPNGNTHFFGGRPKPGASAGPSKGAQKPMGHLMKKTLQMIGRRR